MISADPNPGEASWRREFPVDGSLGFLDGVTVYEPQDFLFVALRFGATRHLQYTTLSALVKVEPELIMC